MKHFPLKMIRYPALFTLLFVLQVHFFGQGHGSTWYFGERAGIDFSSGSAVALTNSDMHILEGCAVASDRDGQLLFYTDGDTVWNRDHVVMLNGTGLNGDNSSTQSAVVVPKPDASNSYYIFTVDNQGGANGLCYSEVDMTMDNGKGGLVLAQKNIRLMPMDSVAEKLAVINHPNKRDFWVLTHGAFDNVFHAFLVNPLGVASTPESSIVGPVLPGIVATQGVIAVSHDGEHIVMASEELSAELFDFDGNTGEVSNPVLLNSYFTPEEESAYGAVFSPDDRFIYVSFQSFVDDYYLIYQYDMDAMDVQASQTLISNITDFNVRGDMQCAPDGKIYVARYNNAFLDVIENPNTAGVACNYTNQGFDLLGRNSGYGLPHIMNTFELLANFSYADTCSNGVTSFFNNSYTLVTSTSASISLDSLSWDFDDPASGAANTSRLTNPTHAFSTAGKYLVRLIAYNGALVDTMIKEVTILPSADASISSDPGNLCLNDAPVTLNAVNAGGLWSGIGITDNIMGTFDPATANVGKHDVYYTFTGPCGDSDTLIIAVDSLNEAVLSYSSPLFCLTDNNPLANVSSASGGTFTINNGGIINAVSGEIDIETSGVGEYTVEYITNGLCPVSYVLNVTIDSCIVPIDAAIVSSDSVVCVGECIDYDAQNTTGISISWVFEGAFPSSSIEKSPKNICYSDTGTYNVLLMLAGFYGTDTVTTSVSVTELEVVIDKQLVELNYGESDTLNVLGSASAFMWYPTNGLGCATCAITALFPRESTNYGVIAIDDNGCSDTSFVEVSVNTDFTAYVPNAFTPDDDGLNDLFGPLGFGIDDKDYQFSIYNRWGDLIFESFDPTVKWDGSYKGSIVETGVYSWKLYFTDFFGKIHRDNGRVTVIKDGD